MSSNAEIGLARKQRLFCLLETVFGTLQFPVGTTDFIRPAGNAMISQNPAFADSDEIQDTLDVLDQFQNAMPPAKWTIPMYLRPYGAVGGLPQGDALFRSLQGGLEVVTAAIKTAADATGSTIVIDTIAGGTLPEKGVVTLAGTATEKVHYTGITRVSRDASSATLTGCTRGYASTTAATHAVAQIVTLSCLFYKQHTETPSMSIWLETDHFVQGLQGAAVQEMTIDVNNEGAVKLTFSGEAMKMVFAGSTTLVSNSLATNTHLHVTDASVFSVGAYIYNQTKHDAGTAASFSAISTVDLTTNIITLSRALGSTGATADVIRGYLPLPTPDAIGDPVESKDTTLQIDGVAGKIKTGSISFKTPKKFIDDEIGTDYPEDFLEDKREITSTNKIYFKKADAKYFADGIAGDEASFLFTFGNAAGSIMDVYLKRCQLQVPTIEIAAPAVELSIPSKALGTVGEDSCEIVIR
jgi:hypothetical protein